MVNHYDEDGKFNSLLGIGVSFLLVSLLVAGFIASIGSSLNESHNGFANSTSQKSILHRKPIVLPSLEAICAETDYSKTCMDSMDSVSKQPNVTMEDYIKTAINLTIQEMENLRGTLLQMTRKVEAYEFVPLANCKDFVLQGIENLNAAQSLISHNPYAMEENVSELNNWMSAVLATLQACFDGIANRATKLRVIEGSENALQMTANMLVMVDLESKLASNNSQTRRLLSDTGIGKDDYPSWFPAADRKLLQAYDKGDLQPDAVVATDGTSKYQSISDAMTGYRLNKNGRYVIYVKAGLYKGPVIISRDQINVYIYGDGPDRTVISGSEITIPGLFPAYQTATLAVASNGFLCKSITIQNDATSMQKGVSLLVQGDKVAFFNCKIEGFHGTLYALAQRQFYRECTISGSKDIIFGDSATVIQKSEILVKKPLANQSFSTITAHGRSEGGETTGFVLQNCTIKQYEESANEKSKIPTYLGRPYNKHSRTIIMQSYLGSLIDPAGWTNSYFPEDLLLYGEYQNNGPGANTSQRVE